MTELAFAGQSHLKICLKPCTCKLQGILLKCDAILHLIDEKQESEEQFPLDPWYHMYKWLEDESHIIIPPNGLNGNESNARDKEKLLKLITGSAMLVYFTCWCTSHCSGRTFDSKLFAPVHGCTIQRWRKGNDIFPSQQQIISDSEVRQ